MSTSIGAILRAGRFASASAKRPALSHALRRARRIALGVVALLLPANAPAQFGLGKPSAESAPAAELVSPSSPRASLQEFQRLAAAREWEQAAEYLSLSPAQRARGPQLARRLAEVLGQRLAINAETLSPLATGDTLDGDPTGDRLGVISGADGREDPVRLVKAGGTPPRWVFAQATVSRVDGWFESLGAPWVRERVPSGFMREGPFHVYWWQWIGIAVAIPLLVLLAWLLGAAIRAVLGRLVRRTVSDWDDILLENLRGPFRLWAAALSALPVLSVLELNPRADGFFTALTRGLALIALFWALLRIIRMTQTRLQNKAWETGQSAQARTLVPLVGNLLRVTLAIVALLVALSQFGYPVGTLLAGLGIGGIAVALAGQKTVEHLFGSVSLAADKAFRVGDWVRAGATEGEVQRIGLRSTSIRTLDRTVVRIPNGRLADERIETFGERDRILLRTDLDVERSTSAEQLGRIRAEIEAALRAHPKIWPDAVRVHVVAFTDSAIRFNVVAWFQTTEWLEFLQIRHEMFLQFMHIIANEGSHFAYPSRTVYHVTKSGDDIPAVDE